MISMNVCLVSERTGKGLGTCWSSSYVAGGADVGRCTVARKYCPASLLCFAELFPITVGLLWASLGQFRGVATTRRK